MTSPTVTAAERLRALVGQRHGETANGLELCRAMMPKWSTAFGPCDCLFGELRAAVDEVEGELAAALARAESAEQKLAARLEDEPEEERGDEE